MNLALHIETRAKFVLKGLIATGRAIRTSEPQPQDGYVKLPRPNGAFYWLSLDGRRLLAGGFIEVAEELQIGFIESMVRVGMS